MTVAPKAGTNQREIDPSRSIDTARQKMAIFHADMMPPPDAGEPVPLDRKAGLAAMERVETPDEARKRLDNGKGTPAHYVATPAVGDGERVERVESPYVKD